MRNEMPPQIANQSGHSLVKTWLLAGGYRNYNLGQSVATNGLFVQFVQFVAKKLYRCNLWRKRGCSLLAIGYRNHNLS
ncbi:hypothetical protein JOD20_003421 [Herpetosiphon giganteus]|nr:hypothetical protein [Herpetosiphon giganteus]